MAIGIIISPFTIDHSRRGSNNFDRSQNFDGAYKKGKNRNSGSFLFLKKTQKTTMGYGLKKVDK